MSNTATDLLRLLGSQAVPGVAPVSGVSGSQSAGGLDFARLLGQAKAGQLSSGREVTIARGTNVTLTDEQLKQLAVAADMAEAQGATRALVMIDGMALRVDVSMREVTGAANLDGGAVMTGIDSVIRIPGAKNGSSPDVKSANAPDQGTLLKLLGRFTPRAA